MAGTYYKYAERQADSYVNWAEIGNNMSSMLVEENKIREDKKAFLDEQLRTDLLKIAEIPGGESTTARDEALNVADNASQFLKHQMDLFKSGKLRLNPYLKSQQKIMDNVNGAFDSLETYQKLYSEKTKLYSEGVTSEADMDVFGLVGKYGNWKNSGFIINQFTGDMTVALRDEKTNQLDPNTAKSLAWVNALMTSEWKKYNMDADVDKFVDALGTDLKQTIIKNATLSKTGTILTVSDKKANAAYEEALNGRVTAMTTNVQNVISVLKDYVDTAPSTADVAEVLDAQGNVITPEVKGVKGDEYFITEDENEFKTNPAAILMKYDAETNEVSYEVSDEQKKIVKDYIINSIDSKLGREEKVTVTSQTNSTYNSAQQKDIKDKQDAQVFGKNLNLFLTGTKTEVINALQYLKDINKNSDITLTADALNIVTTGADGTKNTLNYILKDTDPNTLKQAMANALEPTGMSDIDIMNVKIGDAFSGQIAASVVNAPMPAATAEAEIPYYENTFERTDDEAIAVLTKAMDVLDIKMKVDNTPWVNNITFTAPNGIISPVTIGLNNNATDAAKAKKELDTFIANIKAAQNK